MGPLGESDPLAIASYQLLGVLGSGGMGKVYLGESRSGRRVAIKVVRAELADDPAFRRRFAREVAAVRAVSPLFTAAVVDADTDAAEPWLATTYIDGPSLAGRVATTGPLEPGAVLILAAGLADGLASIHRAGLVHRDLKPSNVIVTDNGPHIIDFGIALSAESGGATSSLLLGTPSYIAPERIHGREADPASDIFSLGATLVYAATGRPLVDEGPVYAQLMQIATGRFSFDRVPPELRPLIARCVSVRAKTRPSADELTQILSAAGVPRPTSGWFTGVVAGPATPVDVAAPRQLTRRRALLAGGVLGAAAAASAVAAVILEPLPPVAYAMRVFGRSASASSPPMPGTVLLQLRSGAAPIDASPGKVPPGQRILVDAAGIVTALGSDVVATRPDGSAYWRTQLSAGPLTLRRWGEGVLVNDARRLWLLDGATGTPRFLATVVDDEERILGAGGNGAVPEIGEIALAPDRAFMGLGTTIIAVDRSGTRTWRMPDPAREGPEVRPTTGGPVTANPEWVLIHLANETGAQVALRSAESGRLAWTTDLPLADPANDDPRGGGPPPPGAGPPPPGGNNPTGGQGDEPPLEPEVDWYRVQGGLTPKVAVLRTARNIRAFDMSDGGIRWQLLAPKPVASTQVIGDLVVIGGDRVRAVSLDAGAHRWQAPLRGARVIGTPDGRLILAASDEGIEALSIDGAIQWRMELPLAFVDSIPDHVSADEHTAFITFKPRGSEREPLDLDVLAIALDDQAVPLGR